MGRREQPLPQQPRDNCGVCSVHSAPFRHAKVVHLHLRQGATLNLQSGATLNASVDPPLSSLRRIAIGSDAAATTCKPFGSAKVKLSHALFDFFGILEESMRQVARQVATPVCSMIPVTKVSGKLYLGVEHRSLSQPIVEGWSEL